MKKLFFISLCFFALTYGSSAEIIEVPDAVAGVSITVVGGAPAAGGGSLERTGTHSQFCDTSDAGSDSITVPADADLAVLLVSGYETGNTGYFSAPDAAPTINSVSMTEATATDVDTGTAGAIFYLSNPATGSQTLAWNWGFNSGPTEGVQYYVVYYKNSDATPLRSACSAESGGSTVNCTPGSASAGDVMVAVAGVSAIEAIGWTNATELDEDQNCQGGSYAVAYDDSYGSAVQITATMSSSYTMIGVMVIK
jgi:hypothetical protein